jgi:hypothetical protein
MTPEYLRILKAMTPQQKLHAANRLYGQHGTLRPLPFDPFIPTGRRKKY